MPLQDPHILPRRNQTNHDHFRLHDWTLKPRRLCQSPHVECLFHNACQCVCHLHHVNYNQPCFGTRTPMQSMEPRKTTSGMPTRMHQQIVVHHPARFLVHNLMPMFNEVGADNAEEPMGLPNALQRLQPTPPGNLHREECPPTVCIRMQKSLVRAAKSCTLVTKPSCSTVSPSSPSGNSELPNTGKPA